MSVGLCHLSRSQQSGNANTEATLPGVLPGQPYTGPDQYGTVMQALRAVHTHGRRKCEGVHCT